MKCHSIELNNQSSLIKDYRNREESIYTHFHYDPYHLQNFKKRYEYLMSQNYQRDQLADVLLEQNEKWGLTDEIKTNRSYSKFGLCCCYRRTTSGNFNRSFIYD